ncbi:MAG: aldolase/citrate lyase family protein, partial [Gemmatimonadales bacterium]
MSIIPQNRLRERLASAPVAVGTMLAEIRQTAMVQALANAGFDWVLIDNEHGQFTTESVAELSRVARLVGVTPIVRVPALTYELLAQTMDAGAQGVMLPRIVSAEEVRFAVAAVKYPPEGRRGSAMGRAHTDFKAGNVVEMMA